jgi:hypothetical protein
MRIYSSLFVGCIVLATSAAWAGVEYPANLYDANLAVQKPEQFAWNMFLAVNWPAKPDQNGVPNTRKSLNTSDLRVWETWILEQEVYLPDGSKPRAFEAPSITQRNLEKELAGHRALGGHATVMSFQNSKELAQVLMGETKDKYGDPIWYDVAMNKPHYDYIVANELYNLDGQLKLLTMPTPNIKFPPESTEVKVTWRVLKKGRDDFSRYITATALLAAPGSPTQTVTVGMTGMHIITKVLPWWTWATFEQMDNPTATNGGKPVIPTTRAAAAVNKEMQAKLSGAPLQFYELRGTQINFTTDHGAPVYLSSTQMETFFQNSSCITCHAYASIGPKGARILDPKIVIGAGVPDYTKFNTPLPNKRFVQLDFVWSLINAKPKKKN